MSAPFRWRPAASAHHAAASGCPRLALRYARNLHGATDRGLPEATALVGWVSAHAASLGLPRTRALGGDLLFPDEGPSGRSRGRGGVGAEMWRRAGRLLRSAEAQAPDFDPVEADIAGLALHYRLDRRVERLFDAISECRDGAQRFYRDTGLITALVGAFPAEVEARLMPDAKLLASGLLASSRTATSRFSTESRRWVRRGIGAAPDLRRAELEGAAGNAAALVGLLAAECEDRRGGRVPIGFACPGAGR